MEASSPLCLAPGFPRRWGFAGVPSVLLCFTFALLKQNIPTVNTQEVGDQGWVNRAPLSWGYGALAPWPGWSKASLSDALPPSFVQLLGSLFIILPEVAIWAHKGCVCHRRIRPVAGECVCLSRHRALRGQGESVTWTCSISSTRFIKYLQVRSCYTRFETQEGKRSPRVSGAKHRLCCFYFVELP